MFQNVAIGVGMLLVTTVVHAAAMDVTTRTLAVTHATRWARRSRLTRVVVVAGIALVMFLATLIEGGLWALTYRILGLLEDFESAFYFSTVTYTTLGFGDVTIEGKWRVLSAIEAGNGILMFGWTTALLSGAVHRVYLEKAVEDREQEHDHG